MKCLSVEVLKSVVTALKQTQNLKDDLKERTKQIESLEAKVRKISLLAIK